MRPDVPPACLAIDENDDFDQPSSQENLEDEGFIAVPLSQVVEEALMAEATLSELLQSSAGEEPDVANLDDFVEYEAIPPLHPDPRPRDVWAQWREFDLHYNRAHQPAESLASDATTVLWVPECPTEAHLYMILNSEDPHK